MANEERAMNFADNVHFLHEGGVKRKIGMLYPDTPIVLNPSRMGQMNSAFALMRDYTDYVYACDLTIEDGILNTLRALILPLDGYYKTATLEKIRHFVEEGGLLVGINLSQLRDLEKDEDYLELTVSEQELVKKWLEGESNLSVDEENSNMEMNEDEDEATKIMLNDRIRSLNGGCDYAVTGLIYLNGQVMYVLELK